MNNEKTYYKINRERLLKRAKEYYENNKERLKQQARSKYKELPNKEKSMDRGYGRNSYQIMSEKGKQKLKIYQI